MVLELEDVPLKEREPLQRRGSKFPIPISPYPSGTLQGLLTPYTPIGRNFEETGDMGDRKFAPISVPSFFLDTFLPHVHSVRICFNISSLTYRRYRERISPPVIDGTEIGEPLITSFAIM